MIPNIPYDVPRLWERYSEDLSKRGITAPRVTIHGGYGKRNLGDDAILHVLITRVQEHLPTARITVVCHGPENVMTFYPTVTAVHFKSIGAVKAIISSHIYIIGGGGIVNRINAYSGMRKFRIFDMKGKFLFLAALFAKLFRARTNFYAIGTESFPDPLVKFLLRVTLSGADVVSVRDALSISNIRKAGVTRELVQVFDPAFSIKAASREQAEQILRHCGITKRIRPLVMLGMRYVRDENISNEQTLEMARELCIHLIRERGCDVLFFPASQHPSNHFEDDLDFGLKLKATLKDPNHFFLLDKYYHPTEMMALLGLADFCIHERLHAVILTSLVGVPFFAISYDDKVTQTVRMLGHEDRMITLEQFNDGAGIHSIDPFIKK